MKKILWICVLPFFLGCLKAPEFKKDYGPEVPADTISKVLSSVNLPSPESIYQGEFVYTEKSVRVESLPPEVINQTALTVVKRTDNDAENVINLTILKKNVEFVKGQGKLSVFEETIRVIKSKPREIPKIFSLPVSDMLSTFEAKPRVTFHNLKVVKAIESVPLLVQIRENCGGLSADKCQSGLNSVRIYFDQVVWTQDQSEKTSFTLAYSPDTPYLSNQLQFCLQALIPVQGQRVNVIQCDDVKDFLIGKPN